MQFSLETMEECIEELLPILEENWNEIDCFAEDLPFEPALDVYAELERIGMLKIITARNEGELIGYSIYTVSPSLHARSALFATSDVLYIQPNYRKTMVGWDLLTFSEEVLKKEGVDVVFINMKVKFPFDSLCEGLEYENIERVYSKNIGGRSNG